MKIKSYIGEATAYDKKLELERKDPLSWLKSVSAFANTIGGSLIFGVSDDDQLVGLANAERDAEDISEIIKNSLDPVPEFQLSLFSEDGKKFMIVTVKEGGETPYYVHLKGHRDAYIRIGNESVKASAIDLRRLVLKGENRSWDSLPSRFKRTNCAFETLRSEYFNEKELEFEESDFESFGLVCGGGTLTNAGALLADKSPIRHSRVFCTRWNGLTKADGVMEALDDDEFSGGLLSLLNNAKDFVKVNSKTKWRKRDDGSGRDNFPEYPDTAVEEAIINALIHRDYLEIGSEIHIDMFDDRMEVYSPGGMMSGDLIQNLTLPKVASRRRNPVIADLFQRLDLMERRGSGFGKILRAYARESKKRGKDIVPSFHSSPSEFVVVLPSLNYGVNINPAGKKNGKKNAEKKISPVVRPSARGKNAKIVIRAIQSDKYVTIALLCQKTHLSASGMYKLLTALKDAQMIRRIGADRSGYWEVIK